jgi:uncharacterized protein YndB with AHSA1/START domain
MTTITDVRREVTVAGTPERAFDLFTNRMAEWWPANHHLATSPVVAMTVEPRVGGRMFDTCETAANRHGAGSPSGIRQQASALPG